MRGSRHLSDKCRILQYFSSSTFLCLGGFHICTARSLIITSASYRIKPARLSASIHTAAGVYICSLTNRVNFFPELLVIDRKKSSESRLWIQIRGIFHRKRVSEMWVNPNLHLNALKCAASIIRICSVLTNLTECSHVSVHCHHSAASLHFQDSCQLKVTEHRQNLHVGLTFSHVRRGYIRNMNNLFIVAVRGKQ
jgi:hypothetical protein